jgi:hypothetical protein
MGNLLNIVAIILLVFIFLIAAPCIHFYGKLTQDFEVEFRKNNTDYLLTIDRAVKHFQSSRRMRIMNKLGELGIVLFCVLALAVIVIGLFFGTSGDGCGYSQGLGLEC